MRVSLRYQALRNEGRKARKQILESVSTVRDLVHLVRTDAMTQSETLNPSASVSARLNSILSGGSLSGVSPIKMRTSSFDVTDHDGEYANGDKVRERRRESVCVCVSVSVCVCVCVCVS